MVTYSSITKLPLKIRLVLSTEAQIIFKNEYNASHNVMDAWAAVKHAGFVCGKRGVWVKRRRVRVRKDK